jgi:hypothetical protein
LVEGGDVVQADLPLDAELGRLVAGDLRDQALDEHLRAPRIQLVDDRPQLPVDLLGAVMTSELVAVSASTVACPAGRPWPPASGLLPIAPAPRWTRA